MLSAAECGGDDLYRAAFEQAANPILLADDDGRYVAANEAAAEMFGVARERLIGMRVTDFVQPAQHTETEQIWSAFLTRRGQVGRFTVHRPDGEQRTLQYHAVTNIRPGLHLSVLLDVTDGVRAERERRESEARLEELVHELHQERAMREGFVAALTHDLRTPLQAAKLLVERLVRKTSADAEVQRLCGRLHANLDRLADMVRDLLDANRIKAG